MRRTMSYAPRGGLLKRGRGSDQLSDISTIVYSSAFCLHSSSTSSHLTLSLFTLIYNALFIRFDMANGVYIYSKPLD